MASTRLTRRDMVRALLVGLQASSAHVRAWQTSPASALTTLKELRGLLAGTDVDTELGWLERSVKPGVELPAAAGLALDDLRFVLSRSTTLGPARKEIRDKVAQDIRLKATYCRSDPRGMGALITLTVHTWALPASSTRVEQGDWQVQYVSTPQTLLPTFAGRSFPQFSSPCSVDLPPGLWTVWAQHPKNAAHRGPAKELVVGATPGLSSLAADVIVP
jgi:hypothetical protein